MIFSPFFRCSIHMTWYHFQTIHRHRGPKAMKAQDIKIQEENIAAHSSRINGRGWRFGAVSLFSCFTQIEGQIWYCIAIFFAELGFQKRRWVTLPAVYSFLAPHSKTSIRKSRRWLLTFRKKPPPTGWCPRDDVQIQAENGRETKAQTHSYTLLVNYCTPSWRVRSLIP